MKEVEAIVLEIHASITDEHIEEKHETIDVVRTGREAEQDELWDDSSL